MTRSKYITIVFILVLSQKWDTLQSFFDSLKIVEEEDEKTLEEIYQRAIKIRDKIAAVEK